MANPNQPSAKPAEGSEETRALRAELAEMKQALAEQRQLTEMAMAEVQASQPLPPEAVPAYELKEPFWTPDNQYMPPGTIFEDITGVLVPNEGMIPLNEPAYRNMEAYLQTLPTNGTISNEMMLQAMMETRPHDGEPVTQKEWHARALARAVELKMKAEGRSYTLPRRSQMPQRGQPAPIMGGARIHQIDPNTPNTPDYRARFMPGEKVARPAPATRVVQSAVSAAEKSQPVFGETHSRPIGTVGPGVQAA